jgi:hypothetical protein
MPLIEEKTGFGFTDFYPDKRTSRCEKCFTPWSQQFRIATLLITVPALYRE